MEHFLTNHLFKPLRKVRIPEPVNRVLREVPLVLVVAVLLVSGYIEVAIVFPLIVRRTQQLEEETTPEFKPSTYIYYTKHPTLSLFVLGFFFILLYGLTWIHFIRTVLADNSVPRCTTKKTGEEVCVVCSNWKPPRAHHCKTCKKCILKMDHHCLWVGNCIGFRNYKFFLCFLFFVIMTSLFGIIEDVPFIIELATESCPKEILCLVLITIRTLIAVIAVLGVTILLQIENAQMKRNATTIETLREISVTKHHKIPPENIYNLGRKENWKEVFGDNKLLWLLPIFTSRGTGLSFPIRGQSKKKVPEVAEDGEALFKKEQDFESDQEQEEIVKDETMTMTGPDYEKDGMKITE